MSKVSPRVFACRVLLLAVLWSACLVSASHADRSFLSVYEAGYGHMKEEVCIGDEESDDYMIALPFIDVDGEGNIFVLDVKFHHITKFDRNGTHVRTFSRLGEGPGEMGQYAVQMAVTSDGTVILGDYSNARLTEFTNDGEYLRTAKIEPGTMIDRMVSGTNGTLFVETWRMIFEEQGQIDYTIVQYDSNFQAVAVVDSMRATAYEFVGNSADRIPYKTEFVWDVTPRGELVIAHNDEYRVKVLSPTLEVIREIERAVEPVRITKDDRRRLVENARDDVHKEFMREVTMSKYKPYIVDLRVDHEGYLLVCLNDPADAKNIYDIYDPSGNYLTSATLAPMDQMQVLRNGSVYFVKHFEDWLRQVCRGTLVVSTTGESE